MTSAQPKPVVFVSMPFGKVSDERYRLAVKPACNSVGAVCERADELAFQGSVFQEVYDRVAKADVIVADISQRNPNVWYELGYAHALGKTTLLLTDTPQDIPSDLATYQVIFSGGTKVRLKEELTRALKAVLSPRETEQRIVLGAPSQVSEARPYAIVYGDVVSSTSMMMRLGELDVAQFLRHYLIRVEGIARKHGGRLVKLLGDSFLGVFDTADKAVAFALDFREVPGQDLIPSAPPIQTRLAVHVAPVVIRHTPYGDDLVGEAVVVAARLAQAAHPGEILLSSSAMKSLPKGYFKHPLRRRRLILKGISRRLDVSVVDVGQGTVSNEKSK